MDLEQSIIFDAGWVFFAGWALVLAAVSVVAFGHDILRFFAPPSQQAHRR